MELKASSAKQTRAADSQTAGQWVDIKNEEKLWQTKPYPKKKVGIQTPKRPDKLRLSDVKLHERDLRLERGLVQDFINWRNISRDGFENHQRSCEQRWFRTH
jgi:hypothetical protein